MLSAFNCGYVVANAAGMIAKYLARSLAIENVVREPRVISNCFPISTISISLVGFESSNCDVGLGQRRRVVRAITRHCHEPALPLRFTNQLELRFGRCFRQEIVDPRFRRDGGGSQAVVAGDHDRLDAHPAQFGKALLDAALHDVFEFDDAEHACIAVDRLGNDQRGAAAPCHAVNAGSHIIGIPATFAGDVDTDRVRRPFAHLAAGEVDAAHARLCGERHEGRTQGDDIALAQTVLLFCQHDYRTPFRRAIGERCKLRRVGEFVILDARCGRKARRLPIAKGNSARLVEQQHIDVAGRLDGAPRHRQHVVAHQPIHPGDADRREQAADGGRDQTHEQRHQHNRRYALSGVLRERQQRRRRQQEDDREPDEDDVQRDLVGRLLPRRALDEFVVTRTTSQSDRMRVPPVTEEKSPPDSRITGADSPVIADSSTEAMPSMTSPSAGMKSPACTR